jgi:hypothetical protein
VTGLGRLQGGRRKAILDGLFIAGLVALVVTLVAAWSDPTGAYDARTYWDAARGFMYARPVLGAPNAYYYSPAFIQLLSPLLALPYPLFLAVWYAILGAALVAVTRRWLIVALATVVVGIDIVRGNIEMLMALAIVVGFRFPAAWAFILLTKVTPGVGLLWFLVRREWRALAMAVGATLLVVLLSLVFAPGLWFDWIRSLIDNSAVSIPWPYFPVPLIVRGPVAAAIVAFGATRNWRWTVPVAAAVAMPALWPVNLTILVAVLPLASITRRIAGMSEPDEPPGAQALPDPQLLNEAQPLPQPQPLPRPHQG